MPSQARFRIGAGAEVDPLGASFPAPLCHAVEVAKPLEGKTILMLRVGPVVSAAMEDGLRARGATVHVCELLRRSLVPEALVDLVHWVAKNPAGLVPLASPFAASVSMKALREAGANREHLRFLCVGESTADALGVPVPIADPPNADGLADLLKEEWQRSPAPIFFARAEDGRRVVAETAAVLGAELSERILYKTVPAQWHPPSLPQTDYVLVMSPSLLRALLQEVPDLSARLVAIGDTTAAAARSLGLEPWAVCTSPDVEGVTKAISSETAR